MIKNAITYSVEMPTGFEMLEFATKSEFFEDTADGEGKLVELYTANKPRTAQLSTIGFAKHPLMGKYVAPFNGGYCLTILKWEKKIDNGAVNARVKEIVAEIEKQGRTVKRKERTVMKDQIIGELLPLILPTPKYTFAYYHTESKTLIVDTTSDKTSDEVTSLLRKCIGSLKATTRYVDPRIGLTEQVANCLDEGEQFIIHPVNSIHPVSIGNKLELAGGDTNGNLKFKDVDLFDETTAAEAIGQIREGGMYVKSVELEYVHNAVTFQLNNGAKIKGLQFDAFEADGEDTQADWQSESFYAVKIVADISKSIVDHFTVVEE